MFETNFSQKNISFRFADWSHDEETADNFSISLSLYVQVKSLLRKCIPTFQNLDCTGKQFLKLLKFYLKNLLFRYDNGSSQFGGKNQKSFHAKFIACSILTMALIFGALIYVFIDSRNAVPVKVPTLKLKPKEILLKPQRGIEVISINGKNESEIPAKRIKRLDSSKESSKSPESEKLIFYPNRALKSPNTSRVANYQQMPANHRMSSRMAEPRPFNHMIGTVGRPNGFQSQPNQPKSTARSFLQQTNNLENQYPQFTAQGINPMTMNRFESTNRPVQLTGKYRHPRKNGELSTFFNYGEQAKYGYQQEMQPDPFYNYKPNSPYDINQLAMHGMTAMDGNPAQSPYFRRRYRQPISSYNHYPKETGGVLQSLLSSPKTYQVDRSTEEQKKALSLLLDLIPMAGEESPEQQSLPPLQYPIKSPRLKPFQGYYRDPSFFNSMQFPQLMPRYPSYYRYAQAQSLAQAQQQQQPQASPSNVRANTKLKPSQLVVHLNLFPKNKNPTLKRSSTEEEQRELQKLHHEKFDKFEKRKNSTVETSPAPVNINFNLNTNGHPENIHHQLRNALHNHTLTTEPSFRPNYYYDENDSDQSSSAAPTMFYHNINRDRPMHMMLRNATKAEKPLRKFKNHKHNYQIVERPRKEHKIKNNPTHYDDMYQ